MRRDANEIVGGQPAPPCERCGQPAGCEIWGFKACGKCFAKWEILAQKQFPKHMGTTTQYIEFTKKFIEEGKRGAA